MEWHRTKRMKRFWKVAKKGGIGLDTVEFRPGIGQAPTTEFWIHRTQEWFGGWARIDRTKLRMSKICTTSRVLQVVGSPSPDMQRSVSRRVDESTQRNSWETHNVSLWLDFYRFDCMIGMILFDTFCSNWWFPRFRHVRASQPVSTERKSYDSLSSKSFSSGVPEIPSDVWYRHP